MDKIIVATANKGKLNEFKEMLPEYEIVGYKTVCDPVIEENGATFKENALIKARAVHALTGGNVLADDSGLSVKALGGAPGVYTARYAGENATDGENMDKLICELDGATDRRAEFICALAFISEDGEEILTEGKTSGSITRERKGTNGFGYNPIFYSDELGKTCGEADEEEKNAISHRGRALTKLKSALAARK